MSKRSKIVIHRLLSQGPLPTNNKKWWWRIDAHWFDGGNKRTLMVQGPRNYSNKVAAQMDMELCTAAIQESGLKS